MSKNLITNVLIGADPEAFLIRKDTGKIISAIGLVPGTKEDPYKITDNKFEAIQTDNVMVEYCQEPTNDPVKFFNDSQRILKYIESIIPEELKISIQASAIVENDQLQNPLALMFGCDPDFNAWTQDVNPTPDSKTNLRTAGGHIHIGYDNPTFSQNMEIVKMLDLYLTLPSLLIDKDDRRRSMYGKAGAFRTKEYGVELRTLSNFWIASQETVNWVFEQVNLAIQALNSEVCNGNFAGICTVEEEMQIQLAINNNNKVLATKLCEKFEINTLIKKLETV